MKRYSMVVGIVLIAVLLMVEASMVGCAKKDKAAERRESEKIAQVSDLLNQMRERGDWEIYVYSEVTNQEIKHYSVRNNFVLLDDNSAFLSPTTGSVSGLKI